MSPLTIVDVVRTNEGLYRRRSRMSPVPSGPVCFEGDVDMRTRHQFTCKFVKIPIIFAVE